jgi:hypothetical protein
MRGGVAHRAPPLIINLRSGDVLVVEQVEQRYVQIMGPELGTVYTHLWNDCAAAGTELRGKDEKDCRLLRKAA